MNLGEVVEQVEAELVFAPNVDKWKKGVKRVINRVHRQLLTESRWQFRERELRLKLRAPIPVDVGDITVLSATKIQIPRPSGWSLTDIYALAGHEVIIPFYPTAAPPLEAPESIYFIEKAEPSSSAASSPINLWVDPRWTSWFGLSAPSSGTMTIRFNRYPLPAAAADVYKVMDRDAELGPYTAISPQEEREYMLNQDKPGTPTFYLVTDDAPTQVHSNYRQQLANREWREMDNRPPRGEISIAQQAGALPAGKYEFFYVWVHSGRISGRSAIATSTVAVGATMQLDLTGLEGFTFKDIGRDRYIFRRVDSGPWELDTILTDPTLTAYSSNVPRLNSDIVLAARFNDVQDRGIYRYIRFWPVPDVDRIINMYWLASPKDLEADEDVPEFPTDYHHYLVHKVAAEIGSRHEGTQPFIKRQEDLAEKALRALKTRYLITSDVVHQRRLFGSRPRNFINYTVNYIP